MHEDKLISLTDLKPENSQESVYSVLELEKLLFG